MMRIGGGSMGGMLLTDKLVFGRLEGFGAWSLDSATPFPSAYPAHASGSSTEAAFICPLSSD
jgi:hypothetical protein